MLPRYLFLCALLCAATAVSAQPDNCGASWDSSATEINGCNAKLEEDHPCSFRDDASTSIAPATEEDRRTVDIRYFSCQILSQGEDECTQTETFVVHGNAILLIDGMLVQRQPGSNSTSDQICFLYDHHDGKSPTEDCRMECLSIEENLGTETIINTNSVQGLPNYGSATRNRHVIITTTGIRSAASRNTQVVSWLLAAITMAVGMQWL
ncbi:expressed unknown protein [Seminavis robusta]|uniref:Uncharacterized protein n=1 Tax=Seminavis robusta TaxID=568900 RepID=A0A9N8EKS1_9STRA|nr:expressed unknown protein [Seminavis robusta]|eukprot:Sro1090_g240150.1 n/a (209) ;mRNA; r:14240-14866